MAIDETTHCIRKQFSVHFSGFLIGYGVTNWERQIIIRTTNFEEARVVLSH